MTIKIQLLVFCLLVLVCTAATADSVPLIRVRGSDTMVNVAHVWSEAYLYKSDVAISVGGGGSGTGFHAMLTGAADLVNASRRITKTELQKARGLGMEPVEHIVGFDALALYLHKDNPLKSITFPQLADIFGRDGKIKKWSDMGVHIPGCQEQEIVRIGRQNSSGTHAYFRSIVLKDKKRYDMGILDMLSSKDVVELVKRTPCAIGYSGLAFAAPEIRMVCVAKDDSTDCITPSISSASDKSYPIARPLFIYSKNQPSGEIKNYLDWILSDEGQCVIRKSGYAPVRAVNCS